MSASWPTSVATDSTLYVAVNELQNNLSGAINNSVTTIGLNSTTGFPSVGLVLIDNEVIKYAGISSNNLTGCTRAFDGTTAASHSSAAVVSFAFCAAHHNNLKDEIIAIETSLNLTASKALSTDTNGRVAVATTTLAELNFVSGVTSAIQTQLNAKAATNLSNVASVSADVPMNSHKFTGLAAGTTNGDSTRFEQLNLNAAGYIIGTIVASSQVKVGTGTTSSGTTYTATNLTASITPKATTHKIKITVVGTLADTAFSTSNSYGTIFRDSTDLDTTTNGLILLSSNSTFTVYQGPMCLVYLDSPASTSSITYTFKIKSDTAAKAGFNGNGSAVFILEEIAA